MSEEVHVFSLTSLWTGDSDGTGVLRAAGRDTAFGRPPQLGGQAGRTNPEELLLGAIVSCYEITLAVLAERKRLPLTRIETTASAEVVRQLGGTLKFRSVTLRPRLTVADGAQVQAAVDAAHKAEQYCVISNAVRGNVEVSVDPEVVVG